MHALPLPGYPAPGKQHHAGDLLVSHLSPFHAPLLPEPLCVFPLETGWGKREGRKKKSLRNNSVCMKPLPWLGPNHILLTNGRHLWLSRS